MFLNKIHLEKKITLLAPYSIFISLSLRYFKKFSPFLTSPLLIIVFQPDFVPLFHKNNISKIIISILPNPTVLALPSFLSLMTAQFFLQYFSWILRHHSPLVFYLILDAPFLFLYPLTTYLFQPFSFLHIYSTLSSHVRTDGSNYFSNLVHF